MDIFKIAQKESGLTSEEIKNALAASLNGKLLEKVLIIPPDFTRYHSNAGFITNMYYHLLTAQGAEVDILPDLMNRCRSSSFGQCLGTYLMKKCRSITGGQTL